MLNHLAAMSGGLGPTPVGIAGYMKKARYGDDRSGLFLCSGYIQKR